MSSTESRRPLRVLSAAEVAQMQQQSGSRNSAPAPQSNQSADRFRRTLAGSSRRAEAPAPSTSSSSAAPREAHAPKRDATRSASPPVAASVVAMPPAEPITIASDEAPPRTAAPEATPCTDLAAAAEPPAVQAELPVMQAELAAAGAPALTSEVPSDPWPSQMARTIASVCTRAAPAFTNWSVTLPMDPQVLPETELRLSLSQHWLSLRFATQSQSDHHLVCRYRQRLLEELERLPNLPQGIDIEVT